MNVESQLFSDNLVEDLRDDLYKPASHQENDSATREYDYSGWQKIVTQYAQPHVGVSIWQIINSFGGFFLGLTLMYGALVYIGYWLSLLLAIPTAGMLMRIFIIQHDCGHGSTFKSRRVNDAVGTICGTLTLTPYKYWRRSHAIHHAHHAQLEERGTGDIWTLTIDEYFSASKLKRFAYLAFRNPIFLFIIAPPINFVILWRFTVFESEPMKKQHRLSVWGTNFAIAGWIALGSLLIGFVNTLIIYLPVASIAACVGVWFFYVQHQFEDTYWENVKEWDYTLAAMHGSSYYELPRVVQWFTGNIGFHHIHHLSPRIPNYKLQSCHDENPLLQQAVKLTLKSSLETMALVLWDDEKDRLVTLKEALHIHAEAEAAAA